jgi:hypothetical protein
MRHALVALACVLWLCPVEGHAQEWADGGVASGDGGLAANDLRDLEDALKRDLAAQGGPNSGSPFTVGSSEAPVRPSQTGPGLVLPSTQSMNPDIALIGDFALAGFSSDSPMQGGGHDPVRNGFNLQGLELAMGASVDPYFRADVNIVFLGSGVEVEEAYATTLALPFHLQARGGQFLTRFGRFNPTHPHAWDFVDQPLFWSKVFGGDGNRGLGMETSWLAPTPWYLEVLGSVTEATGSGTARTFLGGADPAPWIRDPRMLEAVVAVKQFFPLGDNLSLALGVSGATGPHATGRFSSVTVNDVAGLDSLAGRAARFTGFDQVGPPRMDGTDHRTNLAGVDLYLKFRPVGARLPSWRLPLPGNPAWAPTFDVSSQMVSLHAEWMVRQRQVDRADLVDHGGFAQVMWRFTQRGAVAARMEYGAGISGGRDPMDPDWQRLRARGSVAATLWPSEFSRLRLQYSLDRALDRPSPIHAVFLALEFAIGAHGAHAF